MDRIDLLKALPKNGVCAEAGVWRGAFAELALEHASPKHMYLIDPWKYYDSKIYGARYGILDVGRVGEEQPKQEQYYNEVLRKFSTPELKSRFTIFRMPSVQAIGLFSDSFLDWVYLDGCHLYEMVLAELWGFFDKVKPGGYIAGHDYGLRGSWENGVTVAVDEFIGQNVVNVISISNKSYEYLLQKPFEEGA